MARPRRLKWAEILGNQVIRLPAARDHKARRWFKHLLVGMGVVTICALFSSWIHVQSMTSHYRFSKADGLYKELLQIRASLKIESQMLKSPQRIAGVAENELGMILPEEGERVVLK